MEKMTKKPMSAKKIAIIVICAVLAVSIAVGAVIVILASKKETEVISPILELDDGTKIPLSFYELMLSRTKASIAREMGSENLDKFFASESVVKGKTNEEYYNEMVLESCKYYLVALSLFESEKAELPQSYYDTIDQDIQDCIDISYIAGSEEKLNEILSEFGVDKDSYRDAFIINSKYEYLHTYLYGDNCSKIAENVKNDFMNEHYHRFRQILIPSYYYEYETDENGDNMYFDPETGKPIYDTENGEYVMGDNGNYLRDNYQVKIAFDKDGNILYNKEKGVLKISNDKTQNYTKEELLEQEKKAQDIKNSISPENYSAFEAKAEEMYIPVLEAGTTISDYFVSDIDRASYTGEYAYMETIYDTVSKMGDGDIEIVQTEFGYHVIMKYELTDGAYGESDNSIWFENFNTALITNLFNLKCESLLSGVKVNDENIKKAKSIKDIGINYDYWK